MQRSNVAIVSTSINPSPAAYQVWAKAGDLIVAGDQNSPPELHDYVAHHGVYLSPREQSEYSFSEAIGWKNIQRRNAAIFYALQAGYEHILTVDDDNWPRPDATSFVHGHLAQLGQTSVGSVIGSVTGWVNTGDLCIPGFHTRGVPYGIDTRPRVEGVERSPRVVVSQAQVIGDPDCDAVERICHAPDVLAVAANAVIRSGAYTAFNSQATLWHRDWAPVMAVLPGIGRYDDIFASFLFARLARAYNVTLFVGEPVVQQTRNPHDLTKDLRAEYWGMSHVFEFTWQLDQAHVSSDMPLWEAYENLIIAANILPPQAVAFARAWVKEWKQL